MIKINLTKNLARSLTTLAILTAAGTTARAQEALPAQVAGTWKIVRQLPTKNTGCWDAAKTLVGTTLTYRQTQMRWRGGEVPLNGIVTRTVTPASFQKETDLTLAELNILAPRVTEVDMQHDDADVTGSTTEIPGDSVLLVARNTIVVSACGTYFEAIRTTAPAHLIRSSQGQ